ncbi:hypothetical protein [Lysobacter gummosus]
MRTRPSASPSRVIGHMRQRMCGAGRQGPGATQSADDRIRRGPL